MAQGDIQSRLLLNTKDFTAKLDATLKRAQQVGAQLQKIVGAKIGTPQVDAPQLDKAAKQAQKAAELTARGAQKAIDEINKMIATQAKASERAEQAARKQAAAEEKAIQRAQAAAEKAAQVKANANEKAAQRAIAAAERAAAAEIRATERAAVAAQRAAERQAARVPIDNAQAGATAVRDLELQYRKGRITLDELLTSARKWEAQLEVERAQLGDNAKAVAAYTTALRSVENVISRGANTRPVTSGIDNISDALDRLQAVGAVVLSGGFLTQFFRRLDTAARNTTGAKNALTLYRNELRDAGRDVDAETARLGKLATQFKVQTEALARFAVILTRQGFTSGQQAELIEAVGASALSAGRNLDEAFGTAADAFARSDSALLNGLGIITNFDDALQNYAKTQGVTADSLDQSARNQAIYTRFVAETRQEVAALDVLLAGYAGSTASLDNAQTSLGRTIGSVVTPALALFKDTLALVLNTFNALPGVIKAPLVLFGVLTTAVAGLGVAYVALRALLLNQATLGPVVSTVLKNETILRSRLGAAIIVQARAYGILDKAQVQSAVTARNAAIANAAAAGGTTKLAAALGLLAKLKPFIVITTLVLIAREAAKYLGVFAPVVDQVKGALDGLAKTSIGKAISDLTGKAGGLGEIFSGAVLNGVTLVAIAFNVAVGAARSLGAAFQFIGDLATKGPAEAFRLLEARVKAIDTEVKATTNAILDSNLAFKGQIEQTEKAAESTAKLTDEQKKLQASLPDFQSRAAEFEVNFDQTGLKADIASAESEIQSFIDEVGAAADSLPLGSKLRRQYREIELETLKLRDRIGGKVIAEALATAQEETASAVVAAMQEGQAKIIAQRNLDLEAERNAFEDRTNALVEGSEKYNEFLQLYEAKTAAIRAQANAALEQDASQRLETQRNLNERIADAQAELAQEQAASSNDPLKVLANTFQQTTRQIAKDSATLMSEAKRAYQDGAITYQEYQDKLVEIANVGTAQRLQAERDLTTGTNAELERRRQFVEDSQNRIADLRADNQAAALRASGDERGALGVELDKELGDIQENLDAQLEAEGLTQAQITTLHEEANQQRANLRAGYSRKVDELNKQDAESTKKALEDQSKALEDAQIKGKAVVPGLQAQFAQDREERVKEYEEALQDFDDYNAKLASKHDAELKAFVGTEKEREALIGRQNEEREKAGGEAQALINKQNQTETLLARQHQKELNETARDALKAYAQALKQHHDEVARIRTQARQQELSAQKALLDIQTQVAQQETTSANIDVQAAAYERLIRFQEREVAIASNLVDVAKARGATTEEVIRLQEQERQAYENSIGAINEQITALENLRDTQLSIVESGSSVIEYFKNTRELTGGGGANATQVDNALNAQLQGYEDLYREALRANAPLEERIALQEKIKTLIEDSKAEGFNLTLDPGVARLMQGDTLSEVATFPTKASEAVDKFVELNTQINEIKTSLQDATGLFAEFLDKVVGKDGIALKIRVDETALEAEREKLRGALGEELANDIIAQAENSGTKGGKQMISSFANALLTNPDFLGDTASDLVEQSQDAGTKAGKGLMTAMGDGVTENADYLRQKVIDALTPIRDLLPQSDARYGPLSKLSYSGRKLVTTFADGARREFPALKSTVYQMASIAKPMIQATAIPTSRPLHYPAVGTAGAANSPTIGVLNVNGAAVTPSSIFEMSAAQFGKTAARVASQEFKKRR